MTLCRFLRTVAGRNVVFCVGNIRAHEVQLSVPFGVDRIYSFGNIAIVLAFWLEIAIHVAMSAAYGRISG